MFPHADIHGGHSKDRLVRGEQERCGKAVGNAGRHLGEKIGRGGTNDQEICLPAELYMTHFRLILQIPETGMDGLFRKRGKCHRRNELRAAIRSEEQTSELQSLMRNSYAVFCLKNKNTSNPSTHRTASPN